MKHHFVIKLEKSFKDTLSVHPGSWNDLIDDRSLQMASFFPEFDALFAAYHFKFWLAKEYERDQKNTWTEEELFIGLDCYYRIILQQDYTIPAAFLEKIRLLPHVLAAREISIGVASLPVQPVVTQLSTASRKPSDLIRLPYARAMSKGSPAITIAVLDTGVNFDHRELQGKISKRANLVDLEGIDTTNFIGNIKGYDEAGIEDLVGHGTHVSGILAAKGIQMDEGICPGCRIMPVRVLATMKSGGKLVGAGIVDNINSGIKWAVDNGADIINMSLGIRHTGGGLPHEEVIRYALHKNVTIVAASGNDGTEEKYYPGALPGVIAVGAVDDAGAVTNFTSFGADITVVAPGLNIYSSYTQNSYALASGTSQASPFVCGAIALMKSYALEQGKKISNDEILYILKATSDKADNRLRNQRAGYGLINMTDAFKLVNYMLN